MTVVKTVIAGPSWTLMRAHAELVRIRPCQTASLPVWLSYYRHSAVVYEQIATSDPGHEGEALYWAHRERIHAKEIEVRMNHENRED